MEIENYDTLLEKYAGIAFEKQYNLAEIVGDNNWQIDMDAGKISFDDRVSFPMQILGSYAFDTGTWLWAWANEASDIPKVLLKEANKLKKLGGDYNIEFLIMPEYKVESTDVHALGLIASGKFGSSAYYAGNYGNGILLVTLNSQEVDGVEYDEQSRILTTFPEVISVFAINHKRTLKNYLEAKGYKIEEKDDRIKAVKAEKQINADFDDLGRLTNLAGEIKA